MFILDWINLDEFLPLVVLIGLLNFIGGQIAPPTAESVRITRRVAYIVFIVYALAALYSSNLSSPMDFVVIALRASLASGLAYGLTLIAFPTIDAATALAKDRRAPEPEPWTPPLPSAEPELTPPRHAAAEHKPETHVDDARNEVTAFYEKHEEIHEALPPALFRSQVHARFTDDLKSAPAWTIAQEMIVAMLSLIAAAREKKRVMDEEERKRTEQAADEERKRSEAEQRRGSFQKLADWYLNEQKAIRDSLPEGQDRDDALRELFQRYDQLMKDMYAEMKP